MRVYIPITVSSSRSKEVLREETQPEPQPDPPSYLQSEPQIKKQRGRPKKIK